MLDTSTISLKKNEFLLEIKRSPDILAVTEAHLAYVNTVTNGRALLRISSGPTCVIRVVLAVLGKLSWVTNSQTNILSRHTARAYNKGSDHKREVGGGLTYRILLK